MKAPTLSTLSINNSGTPRVVRAARSVAPGKLKALLALSTLAAVSAHAVIYDFLPVTITSTNTAQFTSTNGNGFIIAATAVNFPTNALQPEHNTADNSTFTNLFLASGTVQGWVTRYENNSIYTNTFYLTNYALTSNTVFGIWNMTEETNTYSIKAFDVNGTQISPPFTWNLMGYDDNALQGNIGWVHLVLNTNTGVIFTNIFKSPGTDSDAAFWTNIPPNTAKIVIRGALSPGGRDGVMFYFAEPRPCILTCPSNIVVTICGTGTNVYFSPPTLSGDCGTNTAVLLSDFPSGSFFPLGTNLVIWTVPGQNVSCSFTVTVLNSDTNPPVLTCPSNIVLFTCGTNAVATYSATATDGTNPPPVIIYSTPSGSSFPLGTNSVSCIAIDACSNTTSCAFDVIVLQNPPTWTVTCPDENNSINVTGCPPVLPSLTNLVTISNACPVPGGLSITQAPPAGTVLSAGVQNVSLWVCDTNGSCSNCIVIVNASISSGCCATQTFLSLFSGATNGTLLTGGALDPQFATGAPQFSTPNPYVPSSIHPLWLANGPNSQWIGPVSGFTDSPAGVFAYTNRFFLCSISDAAITGQWTLDDAGSIWLNGTPTGVAITTAGPHASWHPVTITSGFVPGWNTLVFYVTNVVPSVTGLRTELIGTNCCVPNCVSITCPTNITVGTCFASAKVNYPAPAVTSLCGSIASITTVPPSGSYFPIGTNVVQCTVIDSAGNAATCSFTVTVLSIITPLCSPAVTINLNTGTALISWPQGVSGAQLQVATNLTSPIYWDTVTNSVENTNWGSYVTLPVQGDTRFFRLSLLPGP